MDERKPVEIRIARIEPTAPMLPHENRGVGVVEQVSSQVGELAEDLLGDTGMTIRFDENARRR